MEYVILIYRFMIFTIFALFLLIQYEILLDSDVLNLTSPNEYELSWYLPEDNGVDIDYFEISAYPVRWQDSTLSWTRIRQAPFRRFEVPHPGNVRFLVTELYPDTHYTMEIRAHNPLGYSRVSSITVKTARGTFSIYKTYY